MLGTHVQYVVELIFGAALFIKAALFIPQALKLYRAKQSRELSLLTFGGLSFMQLLTMMHAYYREDVILFFGILPSFIICGVITYMIILYRTNKFRR